MVPLFHSINWAYGNIKSEGFLIYIDIGAFCSCVNTFCHKNVDIFTFRKCSLQKVAYVFDSWTMSEMRTPSLQNSKL